MCDRRNWWYTNRYSFAQKILKLQFIAKNCTVWCISVWLCIQSIQKLTQSSGRTSWLHSSTLIRCCRLKSWPSSPTAMMTPSFKWLLKPSTKPHLTVTQVSVIQENKKAQTGDASLWAWFWCLTLCGRARYRCRVTSRCCEPDGSCNCVMLRKMRYH